MSPYGRHIVLGESLPLASPDYHREAFSALSATSFENAEAAEMSGAQLGPDRARKL